MPGHASQGLPGEPGYIHIHIHIHLHPPPSPIPINPILQSPRLHNQWDDHPATLTSNPRPPSNTTPAGSYLYIVSLWSFVCFFVLPPFPSAVSSCPSRPRRNDERRAKNREPRTKNPKPKTKNQKSHHRIRRSGTDFFHRISSRAEGFPS